MDTWIEIAGVSIHSPVTALTNLVLSVQCALYWRLTRTGHADRGGYWSLFFLAMAVATLAGVAKHGLSHMMPDDLYLTVLWASSLGSAASVYYAQRATIVSRAAGAWASRLSVASALQVVVILGVNVVIGPEMWLVVVNTAVGLVPVIYAEGTAPAEVRARGRWIAGGLVLSMLTGVVYMARLSAGVWFNHIDLAHVLMGVSFALMVRGAPDASGVPRHRRASRREPSSLLVGSFAAGQGPH